MDDDQGRVAQIQRGRVATCSSFRNSLVRKLRMRLRSQEPGGLPVLVKRDAVVELILDDEVHHGTHGQTVYDWLLESTLGAGAAEVGEQKRHQGASEELPGFLVEEVFRGKLLRLGLLLAG